MLRRRTMADDASTNQKFTIYAYHYWANTLYIIIIHLAMEQTNLHIHNTMIIMFVEVNE